MKTLGSWFRLQSRLYALILTLTSYLVLDQQSLSRQVHGLPQPQQSVSSSNISLTGLTERAGNINSRYLSPTSNSNLPANVATGSNTVVSSISQQTSNGGSGQQTVASNNHDLGRNYAMHQQAQQPTLTAGINNANSNSNGASLTPTQSSSSHGPQFNNGQPQVSFGPGTPVMSSTFTFNPSTGQFVPADFATGSIGNSIQNTNVQPFQSAFLTNPYTPNPPFAMSPFVNRLGNQNGFPLNFNQPRPPGYVQTFNRRNGLQSQPLSTRFTNSGGVIYTTSQEDDGTFYPQLVSSGIGPPATINNAELTNGGNFGSDTAYAFVNGFPMLAPFGNQQRPQNGLFDFAQPQSQVSAQSTNLNPTTSTFGPTFTNPPQSVVSNQDFKSDQCVAADGRHGTCYQASECIRRGGTPMGKCGTSMNSNEISGSSYVCCLFDITCGQFATERFVYFRNPGYPNTFDQNRMCRARVGKLDRGVCQFRLDLLRFDVAKPTNGNCSNDMFVVSGQNENYVIPKICGLNDGQHYYVGVDESGVITLHMMMMGFYRRSFEILITQIPCKSDYSAPAHCLQYYMGTHGTIKSFNYDEENLMSQASNNYADFINQQSQLDNTGVANIGPPIAPYGLHFNQHPQNNYGPLQQRHNTYSASLVASASNRYNLGSGVELVGGYPNDLDYTMCIRKESGFCSITYQLSRSEQGLQPFAVGQISFLGGGLGNDNFTGGYGAGWHPLSTECRDDYLLIGGVRLCSGSTASQPSLQNSFDGSIQFAQNGSLIGSAGFNLAGQQQLQNQYNQLMQQLARLQLIQQQQQVNPGNSNFTSNGNNQQGPSLTQQPSSQGGNLANQNNHSLEQQQAVIIQQALIIQQQLQQMAANNGNYQSQYNAGNRIPNDGQNTDLQAAIITDTTSGPFILRFVSNMARNARGFHIDYKQNPCK